VTEKYDRIPWQYVDDTRPELSRRLIELMLALMTDGQFDELMSKLEEDKKGDSGARPGTRTR